MRAARISVEINLEVSLLMKDTRELISRIQRIVWPAIVCTLTVFLFCMCIEYGPMGILVGFLLFLGFGGDILLMVFYPGKSRHDDQ